MPFVDHQRPNKKVLPYHHSKRLDHTAPPHSGPVAPTHQLRDMVSFSFLSVRLAADVDPRTLHYVDDKGKVNVGSDWK